MLVSVLLLKLLCVRALVVVPFPFLDTRMAVIDTGTVPKMLPLDGSTQDTAVVPLKDSPSTVPLKILLKFASIVVLKLLPTRIP